MVQNTAVSELVTLFLKPVVHRSISYAMQQATTSLKKRGDLLADVEVQLNILHGTTPRIAATPLTPFANALRSASLLPLRPTRLEILQVNVGKACNQACTHCHVDAGPDRTEVMTRATMEQCLTALAGTDIDTVDITGGAPEMNEEFRWFVKQVRSLNRDVIVRSNLTIIVSNPRFYDLPEFFAEHNVRVVASMPCYEVSNVDRQRGEGAYNASVRALKMLNVVGYGADDSNLVLDLVYNPVGAFLPGSQRSLEADFKRELLKRHGITFNTLHCITNMPISRFLEYLLASNSYEAYMESLVNAFNPVAAANVMCRNTISVGWDGFLYDCDFNQMLEMKVTTASKHVSTFNLAELQARAIAVDQHCYGCTAGAGSSCGGQLV